MKPNLAKKTIYIDPDDDITIVIDKILATKEQIIALVIPKRSSVFNSAVNMKLLKRSADQSDKKLVLITSNNSILPIAGMAGLHVATNPNAKPYVPATKDIQTEAPTKERSALEIDNSPKEPEVPTEEPQAIKVDNTPKESTIKATKKPKVKKDKHASKLKVPNFNKFRTGLIIACLAGLGLIGFLVWAIVYAPKAEVAISSSTTAKTLNFSIKADTKATNLDLEKSIVPATLKEIKRTETEKVPATGTKDMGQKASGSATLSLTDCAQAQVTIPAGTALSANGLNFITQIDVTLQSVRIGPICRNSDFPEVSTAKVKVSAQEAGDKYNVAAQKYTVSGFSNVSAKGTDMSGGVSKIVKVVTTADINSAKQKITDRQNAVSEELKSALNAEGLIPIKDTFSIVNDEFSPTPSADTESEQVVVTVNAKYSMIGVKSSDLKSMVEKQAYESGIDKSKQSILKDGIDSAIITIGSKDGTVTNMSISTNIEAGPQLDPQILKNEIKGKKSGDAEQILLKRPGIKEAKVKTSPFWNTKVPKDDKKIKLSIQGTASADATTTQKP